MEHRWAVDSVTGEFVYGHPEPYDPAPGLSPGQIRVVLDRAPDVRTERYSGVSSAPFRAATTGELAASDTARADAIAARDIDDMKAIRATVICSLWGRLNRQPTGPEIAAERTRWLTIYKNL